MKPKYQYKGIFGLKNIASAYGVSPQSISKYVHQGMSIEKAIEETKKYRQGVDKNKTIVYRGLRGFVNIANEYCINWRDLKNLVMSGVPTEEAIRRCMIKRRSGTNKYFMGSSNDVIGVRVPVFQCAAMINFGEPL